jgi:hypothetical protein
MVWNQDMVQQQLRTTPPRCFYDICPEPLPGVQQEGGIVLTAWKITLGDSSGRHCSVVGIPTLVRSNPPSILLFGNLAVKYSGKLIEIFNPVVHGYHNEISRMEGELHDVCNSEAPDERKEYTCPNCASPLFSLTAFFYYQDGAIEVFLEEPDYPISDMFNSFNLYGVCVNCHEESTIAEFDGL